MTPLLLSLVVGIGLGSILAGIWSAGRVELGILPLGAAGIAVSSVLLFTVQSSLVTLDNSLTTGFVWSCFFLFLLGTSSGLFSVSAAPKSTCIPRFDPGCVKFIHVFRSSGGCGFVWNVADHR